MQQIKKVLVLLRAYSWPASVTPVVIGSVLAYNTGHFSWGDLTLTLLAAMLVHSGANLANTYFDFKNGIDKPEFADDRGIVDSMITPSAALKLAIALLAAGAAIGIILAYKNDIPGLLAVGAAGLLLAWFYTAGSCAYKYVALGDIGIFLAFGPLTVLGTALIQTGKFLPQAFWASIPIGLLISAILHANNMRDLGSDTNSGIKTLAGLLGPDRSRTLYKAFIFLPYLIVLPGGMWPVIFAAVSLPFAIKLNAMAERKEYDALVKETAKFVTIFGLLFSAGLWV